MKTKNEQLYDAAKQAVEKLFSDDSVSKSECKENLDTLMGEIEIMIESLGE